MTSVIARIKKMWRNWKRSSYSISGFFPDEDAFKRYEDVFRNFCGRDVKFVGDRPLRFPCCGYSDWYHPLFLSNKTEMEHRFVYVDEPMLTAIAEYDGTDPLLNRIRVYYEELKENHG